MAEKKPRVLKGSTSPDVNLTPNPPANVPLQQASVIPLGLMMDPALATDYQSFTFYARSFPFEISEAQKKFGLDIYERMRTDACVVSSDRKLKSEVLAKEFRVMTPENADARTCEIAAYEERCLLGMQTSLEDVAWQMLDMIAFGHSLTDITWGDGMGTDSKYDVLHDLRVIPPNLYTIVLDAYGRFLGVVGRQPGRVPMRWVGPVIMPLAEMQGFVPYWKLCICTHSAKPGDLRGVSRYDGAYNPYKTKLENWSNWLYYQRKFGRVKTFVTLGEGANARNPGMTAEEEWTQILANSNYDISALPKNSTVAFQTFADAWEPFSQLMQAANREIALAITGGSRASVEAEKSGLGNSDAQVAQQGIDMDTDYLGNLLCRFITKQVLRPLVKARFGMDAEPCPLVMHRDEDEFNNTAQAISMTWDDFEPEQQDEIMTKRFGLKPSIIAPEQRREEKKARQTQENQAKTDETAKSKVPEKAPATAK